jgi:hypothetical protein
MQHVQFTPAWKRFSFVVVALFAAAAIFVWAKPMGSVITPATVGAAVPVEASVISPMELMIRRGHNIPVQEYVEPF